MTTIDGSDTTIGHLVATANIEVIPLRGAEEKTAAIPTSTTVTITCSPKFGLDRTLDHVVRARESGHRVVPHLAARMVEDEAQLKRFLATLSSAGVDDLYVIGGDGEEPVGKYSEAFDILEAIQGLDHNLQRIGVGCYPEASEHPRRGAAGRAAAQAALRRLHGQPVVLRRRRLHRLAAHHARGRYHPAVRIGIAAPLQTRKLIELSLKIGVGSSVKFLTKQHGFVGNLLLGRSYTPETLITEIVAESDFEQLGVEGLHMFSFNQVDATVEWQSRMSAAIAK